MAKAKVKMSSPRGKMSTDVKELGGFTIIEVVLVLAIAGLIFLMVFLALPALQRSQRDTQRRNDLSRVSTAITNYQANNNNRLPGTVSGVSDKCDSQEANEDGTAPYSAGGGSGGSGGGTTAARGSACSFIKTYLNSADAGDKNYFVDPSGMSYGLKFDADASSYAESAYSDHLIHIVRYAKCGASDGEVVSSTHARDYAVLYVMEGSGVYCKDNSTE